MMFENDEERFNEWLRDEAQSYNVPGPSPRDALWARIAAERQRRATRVIELKPWLRWPLAVAAILALGIGIGRWTARQETTAPSTRVAASDSARGSDVVYQVAATQYLSRTEAFLTDVRADLRAGRTDVRFAGQARDLLITTRLLLDSPAADDARQRALLEDLELVLVQISQLQAGRGVRDADLITQGMDQRNVLPKLRSAIPSGPVPVRTGGVL
ncbi:MAG TPA: hypothetical protein VGJ83_06410 [Gemmatimonadales bacterium]|jgi:hypothetical protein